MTTYATEPGSIDSDLLARIQRFKAHPGADLAGVDDELARFLLRLLHSLVAKQARSLCAADADDAVSEVMLKVLKGIKEKYDPALSSPATFVWRLGHWRLLRWLDQHGRRGRGVPLTSRQSAEMPDRGEPADDQLARKDEHAHGVRLLDGFADEANLRPHEREALALVRSGGRVGNQTKRVLVRRIRRWHANRRASAA